ncbi:protocadherin-like wing polarity protein stan, partial [Hyalella azteca]|uniref:Protocadherin-like wing polarity protein stan n=1 Tax=Hyalella azteca TaxID=294128 RepID=A0A8B7NZT7_HYAAZ
MGVVPVQDGGLCLTEPCWNYDECLTVLKFGNASNFISSNSVFFRPIYPVTTNACRCPKGFTGMQKSYECDTEVDLCYSSPCGHHGTCMPREGGYTCLCLPGYTGVNCEVNMLSGHCVDGVCRHGSHCTSIRSATSAMLSSMPRSLASRLPSTTSLETGGFTCSNCTRSLYHTSTCELRARRFAKGSFLTFPALKQRHRMLLKISFATRTSDGLLLYNGRYNDKHDFISLEIVDGAVVFSFNLGDDTTRVAASLPHGVDDGDWHTVTVDYLHRVVTVSIDDCDTAVAVGHGDRVGGYYCANTTTKQLPPRCASHRATCNRFLDLTGPLQVGGLPSLPEGRRVQQQDFFGCIADLYIDHKFIDLNSCPSSMRLAMSIAHSNSVEFTL